MYMHPGGLARKQERLSLVMQPLLKVCNALLPYIEENYLASGLHADFAKKRADSTVERSLSRRWAARDDRGQKLVCC